MDKISFLKTFMEDVWNNKNIENIEEYIFPAYQIHLDKADPWEGKTLSFNDFIMRLRYSFDSFPDMHFNILSAIEDGDNVAITWILTGTNLGKIGDMPSTNKPIKTNGITIYHFKDNKICGHTQVFDRMTVFRQLGFPGI